MHLCTSFQVISWFLDYPSVWGHFLTMHDFDPGEVNPRFYASELCYISELEYFYMIMYYGRRSYHAAMREYQTQRKRKLVCWFSMGMGEVSFCQLVMATARFCVSSHWKEQSYVFGKIAWLDRKEQFQTDEKKIRTTTQQERWIHEVREEEICWRQKVSSGEGKVFTFQEV